MNSPHRRFNPLTRQWVLVSPHRARRPWLGHVEKQPPVLLPQYDPECYLCPGNARAGGIVNPHYQGVFTFDNDFPALLPPAAEDAFPDIHPLLQAKAETGICRVVCFSPRHDLTLPELNVSEIEAVIDAWTSNSVDLAARNDIAYVQVFENKGAIMGCSNPHPHSQIWAQSCVPNEPAIELITQSDYLSANGSPMLVDYVRQEQKLNERIIFANEYFSVLVPFWAIWPFEVMLVAHRSAPSLADLSSREITALAEAVKVLTTKYDNLFEVSFPYSSGFHQAPADGAPHPEWVLHAHFYPPLLRSATVKKFMVGYEMMAMPQRDITPEVAAQRLRDCPDTHYKLKN